jgi:hypothetical protein
MDFIRAEEAVDEILGGPDIGKLINVSIGLDGFSANVYAHVIPPDRFCHIPIFFQPTGIMLMRHNAGIED